MSDITRDFSWLPSHQEHVVYTLAHVDSVIGRLSDVLYEFQQRGVFEFASRYDAGHSYAFIARVQPLPAVIPRLFADAATQLRAAVEHSLFAQVEFELGQTLDAAGLNARRVEMPAFTDPELFTAWLKDGARKKIGPLQEGEELVSRIRQLQPFWHIAPDTHPMKLIAEHTKHSKHRAPAIAVTRVGPVIPDSDAVGLELAKPRSGGSPARVGDLLARGPRGLIVPIGVYPDISVERPHTKGWNILAHELNNMFEWVRTEALPILIAGSPTADPFPPRIDITIGYDTVTQALESGERSSSFERNGIRLQAHTGRDDLAGLISDHEHTLPRAHADQWVSGLSDQEVVDALTLLGESTRDVSTMLEVLNDMVERATASVDNQTKAQ